MDIKKVFIVSFFLCCIFFTKQLFTQNAGLSGKVLSELSMQPIAGANVLLMPLNIGRVTDSEGRFSFEELAAGSYKLTVSHVGFSSEEKNIQLRAGQRLNTVVVLHDSIILTQAVDIVAEAAPQVMQQVRRIHTLSAGEIAMSPVTSVNQLMDYTAGVLSNNTTGIYSGRVVVTMRGMPANDQSRTLVILDGMPLNKADGGSVNWHLLNKDNLEEINIIKGPGPAKFGSGAMGGVIEMTSRRPSEKTTGELNFEYGTFNTLSGNLRLSGSHKLKNPKTRFYWLSSTNVRQSDGYITTPEVFHTKEDTILVPAFLKEFSTNLKAGVELANNSLVECQLQFFDDMRGNGVQVFDNFGAYSTHQTLSLTGRYKGMHNYIKWNAVIFNNTENYFRVYEYMNEGEYKLYEADAERKDGGINLDFDYFRFKSHKISFGINGKMGSVDGRDIYYTSTDIIYNAGKMDIAALYLQDDISIISEKLSVNAGLRYDYARFYDAFFSIDYPSYAVAFYKDFEVSDLETKTWDALSPRLSLRYNPMKNLRVFLSYAGGFRAPILDDMTRTGSRRGTFAVANPKLKPERLHAYELGGDIQLTEKLLLSASAYYSIGKDFMYFTSTGDTVNMGYRRAPIITRSNIGRVGISGTETEIKFTPNNKLSCFLNYSYTHAIILEHEVKDLKVDSNLTGKYLTDIPIHKIAGGITYRHKIVNSSLMGRYYGQTWINDYNTIDTEYFLTDKFEAYMIYNLRLERTFKKWLTLYLQVENIMDAKYIDSRLNESPGRMLFVGVKLRTF